MRVIFLIVLLFPTLLAAQIGQSQYALMHPKFPCRKALSAFRGVDTPTMAILWGTFGNSERCLKRYFQLPGKKTLEIHFSNEVCRRNKRCAEGELFKNLSVGAYNKALSRKNERLQEGILRRVYRILRVVKKYAKDTDRLLLSTGLEDNFTPAASRSIIRLIKAHWPYEIVRNPVRLQPRFGADFVEYHGLHTGGKAPCVYNLDGQHISFDVAGRHRSDASSERDVRALLHRARRCEVSFLWSGSAQGLKGNGTFVKPRRRSFVISSKTVRVFRAFMREKR